MNKEYDTKYRVIDTYDGIVLVGYAKNETEVDNLCKYQDEETDGECWLIVQTRGDDNKWKQV